MLQAKCNPEYADSVQDSVQGRPFLSVLKDDADNDSVLL